MKRVMIFLVFLVACAKTLPVQTPVEIAPEEKAPVEVPVIEEVPFPVIENCVDLDNADIFVKGRVVKGEKVLDDSCLSLKEGVSLSKVVEYVCENNEIVAKIFSCEYGCKEGACIKDVQKQFLVQNGECALGGNFKVTKCFDGCLPGTMCVPTPLKTKHYDFPYQLACLVSSDEVSSDVWFEFEVPYDMTVVLFAEVEGGELVLVQVEDANGKAVAAPLNGRIGKTCFTAASGHVPASLKRGIYSVRIAAKADGDEKFRSFRAKNFAIAIT